MAKDFVVWATSSPTGLSIIGRRYTDSTHICDLYTTKMTMNPETGERYFSFAPLNPLAVNQLMPWDDFVALANRGVHCGLYEPAVQVTDAYLGFVDSEERRLYMAECYLVQRGPCQEYLDKLEHEKAGTVQFARKQEPTCDGKIIKGVFKGDD